jgi:ubiquitin-like-conjugating enzyme ATG3
MTYPIVRAPPVPCMRRATSLAYTDADEDDEKLLSFGDDGTPGDKEEEWVQTHSGRSECRIILSSSILPSLIVSLTEAATTQTGDIEDIPDDEPESVTSAMGNLNLGKAGAAPADAPPDLDEIPDMEEEGLEKEDDAAVVAPVQPE